MGSASIAVAAEGPATAAPASADKLAASKIMLLQYHCTMTFRNYRSKSLRYGLLGSFFWGRDWVVFFFVEGIGQDFFNGIGFLLLKGLETKGPGWKFVFESTLLSFCFSRDYS